MSFTREKELVRMFHALLDQEDTPSVIPSHLTSIVSEDYIWRGFYPFDHISDFHSMYHTFWRPLTSSLTSLQRRMDIFFAGKNEMDDFHSTWVVSMGHLMGLFDRPFAGIPPTGKMAFLRYCEFNRVEDGKITETAFYFDLPHLMLQAGIDLFPKATAASIVQPGPQTHDGVLFENSDPQEGVATLALINAMINDIGQWKGDLPLEEELRRTWHEDMIWWGPTGIGATYTIPRYAAQHSQPFRHAFSQRSTTKHIARLAEGHYGGFFGWPNFSATLSNAFMGQEATHKRGDFRVIDLYRRKGDKLAENWIFIDLLYFWKQQGRDFLKEALG